MAVAVALAGLTATSMSADAQAYRHGARRHVRDYGRAIVPAPALRGYGTSPFTGRDPDYLGPLGLSDQTATGGPVGGSRLFPGR